MYLKTIEFLWALWMALLWEMWSGKVWSSHKLSQVLLSWYKSFLEQCSFSIFVKFPFPGCPWTPKSSWGGAESHQRSRSKDWGEQKRIMSSCIMHVCSIRCRWTANTTLWVGLPSLFSQRQQLQFENTARAPKTMFNSPLVRIFAVIAQNSLRSNFSGKLFLRSD